MGSSFILTVVMAVKLKELGMTVFISSMSAAAVTVTARR
jgi:hypothetical protein